MLKADNSACLALKNTTLKISMLHYRLGAPGMINKPKFAVIYDFDGTLARGNLQETSFIPNVGMDKDAFWKEVHKRRNEHDADEVLVYMHLMLEKANQARVGISKQDFNEHGKKAELFEGLSDGSWFERINRFGEEHGIIVEHFIVSSGIEEMISGCSIKGHFTHIFASKFIYENDKASWPGVAINYTTKTQYLFRINKGILNHSDNKSLNAYTPEHKRHIPFNRMIFVGDGDTDIPTMKMLTHKGGHSIAVYDPMCQTRDVSRVHQLISDSRVNFVAPANYLENSQLDIIIKGILGRAVHQLNDELSPLLAG